MSAQARMSSEYFDQLTEAMTWLGKQPDTVFYGQSVEYGGQRAFKTFAGVPEEKRVEMPICEDFTVGFCTGFSLEGYVPVCFIPRWDFLLLAANQIINHLDKIPVMGDFRPKVIIRTAVGGSKPLDPGPQHKQNYTMPFRQMLQTMDVHELFTAKWIVPTYQQAYASERSCIVVEHMSNY